MPNDHRGPDVIARRRFLSGALALGIGPFAVTSAGAQVAPRLPAPSSAGPVPSLPIPPTAAVPAVNPIPAPGGLIERPVEIPIDALRCAGIMVHGPGTANLPGLLVVPELGGIAPHHTRVARRLAALGYLALIPNFVTLYGQPDDRTARNKLGGISPAHMAALIRQSVAYLVRQPSCSGAAAVVAFGWGGPGLVLLAADPGPIRSMVLCSVPIPSDQIAGIKIPLQLHYATLDERTAPAIETVEKRLMGYSKIYEQFVYENLTPAFLYEGDERRYNGPAASMALERMEFFLARNLKPR
jgi:carboxymethylenebutenolidase